MYLNTTYKAFVADTAAKLYAEMVVKAIEQGKLSPFQGTSFKDNEDEFEFIANQATFAAEKLATKLQDWWTCTGDRQTVMFDPQDSLTSRIENELSGIAEKLQDIEVEMERQYKNDHMDEQ